MGSMLVRRQIARADLVTGAYVSDGVNLYEIDYADTYVLHLTNARTGDRCEKYISTVQVHWRLERATTMTPIITTEAA